MSAEDVDVVRRFFDQAVRAINKGEADIDPVGWRLIHPDVVYVEDPSSSAWNSIGPGMLCPALFTTPARPSGVPRAAAGSHRRTVDEQLGAPLSGGGNASAAGLAEAQAS